MLKTEYTFNKINLKIILNTRIKYMYKKIIFILSTMAILFAISCNNQPTKASMDVIDKEIISPEVDVNTDEAKAFLALFAGKTKVVAINTTEFEIKDGGRTLIDINITDNNYVYNFQSTKNATIAYYTEKWSPKLLDPSLPDKIYYSYIAFEVKSDKLIAYYYYTVDDNYKGDKYLFDLFDVNVEGDVDFSKPKMDVDKMDFSPLIPRKNNIDFNLPNEKGTIQ